MIKYYKRLYFDCETGNTDAEKMLATFEPEFEADARLKDPDKIAADIAIKQQKWVDDAGLKAERGKMLAIGYSFDDEPITILAETKQFKETSVISSFLEILDRCSLDKITVCGFNMMGFDLPFLRRRALINGIKTSCYKRDDKWNPWSFKTYDAMLDWQSGDRREFVSLDRLSRALGGKGKMKGVSGGDFAKLYETDPKKALAYLHNDVEETRFVVNKMII